MQTGKIIDQMVDLIQTNFAVDAIYLYGSRAKGKERPDSDWDLAVLFSVFEPDLYERVLRPQKVEEVLQRELLMYDQISVVDLEIAPPANTYLGALKNLDSG
ncbi:MAG: nucleotidyltransferase domain-containing protein [Desulfovermiculus sp.]